MFTGTFRVASLSLLAASLCAWGCGPATVSPAPGRTGPPKRVVSPTPVITEILFGLGVGGRVVGVTDYCTYPPEAQALPKVGGYINPSVEAVLALAPDLVLVSPGPGNREAAIAMRRAGLRVEIVPAETLEESFSAIESIARLAGVEAEGRRLVVALRSRIATVSARVAGLPRVPTLFSVQVDPIIAAGIDTLPSQILELAGGRNVIREPRYPRLGIESVAAARPEVILQARMDVSSPEAHTEESFWKRWPTIPAVAHGRVVVLPDDLALRAGPRIADAVEELAAILHPVAPGGTR